MTTIGSAFDETCLFCRIVAGQIPATVVREGKIYLNFEGAQRPEEVGASVVRSLIRNRPEAAVGFVSWWVWFGKRFSPRVPRWVMHWKAARGAKRGVGG